mgnify:CR=1 FL=1
MIGIHLGSPHKPDIIGFSKSEPVAWRKGETRSPRMLGEQVANHHPFTEHLPVGISLGETIEQLQKTKAVDAHIGSDLHGKWPGGTGQSGGSRQQLTIQVVRHGVIAKVTYRPGVSILNDNVRVQSTDVAAFPCGKDQLGTRQVPSQTLETGIRQPHGRILIISANHGPLDHDTDIMGRNCHLSIF